MQFVGDQDGNNYYAIYNVSLKRSRNSKNYKAGTPLPAKQFRVSKRSGFYKFWLRTGLKFPPRLSSFHDYMGNLSRLEFTASFEPRKPNRLIAESISLCNAAHIDSNNPTNERRTYKCRAANNHQPNTIRTNLPYKDWPEHQPYQGLHCAECTCLAKYENKFIRHENIVIEGHQDIREDQLNNLPSSSVHRRNKGKKDPRLQTNQEWLDDYGEE